MFVCVLKNSVCLNCIVRTVIPDLFSTIMYVFYFLFSLSLFLIFGHLFGLNFPSVFYYFFLTNMKVILTTSSKFCGCLWNSNSHLKCLSINIFTFFSGQCKDLKIISLQSPYCPLPTPNNTQWLMILYFSSFYRGSFNHKT